MHHELAYSPVSFTRTEHIKDEHVLHFGDQKINFETKDVVNIQRTLEYITIPHIQVRGFVDQLIKNLLLTPRPSPSIAAYVARYDYHACVFVFEAAWMWPKR